MQPGRNTQASGTAFLSYDAHVVGGFRKRKGAFKGTENANRMSQDDSVGSRFDHMISATLSVLRIPQHPGFLYSRG